jgi:nucleoside 2-deoxyribosyltransferase
MTAAVPRPSVSRHNGAGIGPDTPAKGLPMKIYLASPYGFTESTIGYMDALIERLRAYGEILNPWDNPVGEEYYEAWQLPIYADRMTRWADINTRIAQHNEQMIRDCDILIAALEGVDVDSGTAAEIGFAYALGKRVHGFRIDRRQTGENEACLVNLQVRWFIDNSGGKVVRSQDALIANIAADVAAWT